MTWTSKQIEDYKERVEFFEGDIRNKDSLIPMVKKCTLVFHIASYGMSGREMLQKKLIREVNVVGTQNLVDCCLKENVPYLIYTSTYNVVFGGQSLENQDESLDYFPVEKHSDEYSRTKSLAEQFVLKNNGKQLQNGKATFQTCSLRASAIYGEGEQRHFPRLYIFFF